MLNMNVYAKFRCAARRIKKALGIFRELIPRTRRTTKVAFWDRLPGQKSLLNLICDSWGWRS